MNDKNTNIEINETKEKILDTAEHLFYTKGYEATPISEILKQLNIAKGTLYHHFKNKEDILDQIIVRQGEKIFAQARNIAKDKSIPADKRLIMTLMSMQSESKMDESELDSIHTKQNALLHEKINEYILDYASPFLTEIIVDGNKDKIFNTPYPKQVVEMILIYVNIAFDHLSTYQPEEIQELVQAFIFNIYRLTGAKEGSLDFSEIMRGVM